MGVNLTVTLVGYVLMIAVALGWVFASGQKRVPRTARTALHLSLRTLPLFLVFFGFCQLLGMNPLVFVAILVVVGWVSLVDPGCFGLGAIGILYVIQQWILGWPDRSWFILDRPEGDASGVGQLDELAGEMAVTRCPLRPSGVVVLGRREYPACSDLGYIERGMEVMVVGRKGTSLLVRPIKETTEEGFQINHGFDKA